MNPRIRELAEQAGAIEAKNITNIPRALSLNGEEIQKFAELIVRECADIAKQTDIDDGDDYKSGRVWAGIDILKHFNVGVES
jgi:hypothetical protein